MSLGDTKRMIFDVIAKDHASATFDKVSRSTGGSSRGMAGWKKAAVGGLVAVTGAAVVFGKKSVDAYKDVAQESSILSRLTGENIKDAGRLRFAAHESGVEFATLSTSMKLFSKNTAAAAGDSKKMAAMTDQLGFSIKDSHGKLLPMAELLPKVADRFKSMPDGPQKTALALKLFGKSGADMIKVLNKGSDGIKELGDEGEKTGNVLKNTDGYKEQLKAQRAFQAASEGLKVQLGAALFPIITKVTLYLAEHVGPVFTDIGDFVSHNSELIGLLAKILLPLIAAFVAVVKILRIFTAVMAAVNFVLDANPIGIVVIAIAALAAGFIYAYKHSETFRKIVDGAFTAIGKAGSFLWNSVLKPAFKAIINGFLDVASWIVKGAAKAFGWIPGIGPKLKTASAKFDAFKTDVNNKLDGIKPAKIKVDDSDARAKVNAFRKFFRQQMGLVKQNANVHVGVSGGDAGDMMNQPYKNHARGTPYWPGGPQRMNEEGRGEIVDLPNGSRIIPAGLSAAMSQGGGGDVHIHIEGGLDSANTIAERVEAVLRQLKKQRGWSPLGFELSRG